MAKVHITLVGGQPAPVYYGILYANPDKVVYLYSDETRDIAKQISEEVKIPSEKRCLDPVDLNDIEKKIEECRTAFLHDEISVNISSGTKPWSYYSAKILGDMPNAKLFYVDQNNTVWNLSDKTSERVSFDMDAQFRLYGNPLEKFFNFTDYGEDDLTTIQQISELQKYDETNLFRLIAGYNNQSHLTKTQLNNGSFIEWLKDEKAFVIHVEHGKKFLEKKLQSTNVRQLLLKAGWFEYRVASMLSQWSKAKEIRMNCRFPYKDSAIKNEIDVLVNTGTKLLFVECKTQIEDNTDIDKFRSAVNNYGGLSSKALFVTNSRMKNKTIEKCADNGIITFSLQDNHNDLSNEQALISVLDNELFNINAR